MKPNAWLPMSLPLWVIIGCALLAPARLAAAPSPAPDALSDGNSVVRFRTVEVDGVEVFYREAGDPDAPVMLLLHGFPASSFMYRQLIEQLAGRFHVLAPDFPGFGHSEAPSTQVFPYTFDRLAGIIEKFTDTLRIEKYSLYMQDFGGPVGFRLASRHPEKVQSLIVQNANAYEEGLPESFWAPVRAFWQDPSPANREKIRHAAMSEAALEWNYVHGVAQPERIDPDSWLLQHALLSRPGNKDAMLSLLYDYRTNPGHYAAWQQYFRKHQPPTLIVWGRNDAIFPEPGARAYLRDLPRAELHLLDTGHFALEDKSAEIAQRILEFTDRRTATR